MKFLLVAVVSVLSLSGAPSLAQSYPDRAVKLVVPFAPGGIVDVVGRALARQLEAQLSRSVFIENRTGAGAQVGTAAVASAQPDGYTLLLVDPSVTTAPTLQQNAPYQLKQLRALATVTTAPLMVVVHPSLPVKSLRELIEYSKNAPDGVTYASAGIGTTPHLAPELLKVQTGFKATHVPYRGGGASVPDLVSGRVQTAFFSNATVLPLINDGRLRAIAQTGTHRLSATPDVPTAVESGYPEFVVELWTALFVPVGIPADIEKRLEQEIKNAVESDEFVLAIQRAGVEVSYRNASSAQQFVQSEYDRWSTLIKAAKITAN